MLNRVVWLLSNTVLKSGTVRVKRQMREYKKSNPVFPLERFNWLLLVLGYFFLRAPLFTSPKRPHYFLTSNPKQNP